MSSLTRSAGRTLKPMMTASDATARLTSFSVMAPTPRSMIRSVDVLTDIEVEQRVLERLDRTGDVALEDEVELCRPRPSRADEDVFERAPATLLGELSVALAGRTSLGDLPGDPVFGDDEEVVAGVGDAREPEHLDGT